MIRRSVKVLTAAAILGISPALLSAQVPVESPSAELKSQTKSNAQIKARPNAPDAPVDRAQKRPGTNPELKASPKLGADVDARTKSQGKTNAPNLTPPPRTNRKNVDGAISRNQNGAGVEGKVRGGADVDVPMRHKANRPITDGDRQKLQGQGNIQIDAVVRQGTAHLNIDDATRARYRHHNGHWWYKTENDQWLIDNNGTWEPFDPVTYRRPNQQGRQDYYQDQGNVNEDFQADGSYYYEDDDYYYYDNGYGNRAYNYRGNGYNRNRYNNGYRYGNGRNGRGYNNNRGQWNNGRGNNNRGNNGNRGRSDRRQGAAVGAEIGGALGGSRGARIGAGIGANIAD